MGQERLNDSALVRIKREELEAINGYVIINNVAEAKIREFKI